jgi:glycogen debranching enzyme
MIDDARQLLAANTETAEKDGRVYTFTVPSRRQYPFQWFWDSCFHAIVWARLDPERAKEELRSLFAWQEPSGFIPHVVFWDPSRLRRVPWHWHYLETLEPAMFLPWGTLPKTTRHIQPPVLAQAVERVVEASGCETFRAEALPVLERYYRWLARARDPDGDGLISIIAQFESGLDYCPAYDVPLRVTADKPLQLIFRTRWPTLVNKLRYRYDLEQIFERGSHHQEDVLVNSIYAQGLRSLARLARGAGDAALAGWADSQARRVTGALLDRCFDEGAGLFWNLAGANERPSRVSTVISLMPLILDELPGEVAHRLVQHLTDPREYWAAFPVPAVALNEPRFAPTTRVNGRRLIWRGPLSMNTNWFLVHGLRQHGFADVAETIATKSRELVARGGFNEFYNPLSGEPVGEERFGWATLAVDL